MSAPDRAASGPERHVSDRADLGGLDPLERELRRMAVLQRRSIAQRRRPRRRGPQSFGVRGL